MSQGKKLEKLPGPCTSPSVPQGVTVRTLHAGRNSEGASGSGSESRDSKCRQPSQEVHL